MRAVRSGYVLLVNSWLMEKQNIISIKIDEEGNIIGKTSRLETDEEYARRRQEDKDRARRFLDANRNAVPLICDKCGGDTGAYVDESDLNGSYFFCASCHSARN